MKTIKRLSALWLMLVLALSQVQAQQTPAAAAAPLSKYNYNDAFSPIFYTRTGNEYRSASGQPGAKYWQNRADYQLSTRLNETTN